MRGVGVEGDRRNGGRRQKESKLRKTGKGRRVKKREGLSSEMRNKPS